MSFKVARGKKDSSREELFQLAREYSELSANMKMLEETKKSLATKIKDLSVKLGVVDNKGSHYCENDEFICGNVAKHKISLDNDKAVVLLQKKGLTGIIEEKIVKVIDEKKLEKAVAVGDVTQSEFESVMIDKVTYQVSVTKKDSIPVVEQSYLMAASKK